MMAKVASVSERSTPSCYIRPRSFASLNTSYVSYAYPAGASVEPINEVVIPPTPK
jgi:hypothetical protein